MLSSTNIVIIYSTGDQVLFVNIVITITYKGKIVH